MSQRILNPQTDPLYAELGIEQGWKPTPPLRLRIALFGFTGCGKTTFVASMPNTLILDMEDTVCDVANPRAHRKSITSIEELDKIIDVLVTDTAPTRPFQHVVIDTLDALKDMMVPYATREYNSKTRPENRVPTILEAKSIGYGYSRTSDLIQERLQRLYQAGYGWTITGHLKRKDKPGESGTKVLPVLWESITGPIYRRTQVVANIEKTSKIDKVPTGKTIKISGKPVPELRQEERYIFTLKLGIVSHDLSEAEAVKTRYISEMPKRIDLPRFYAWERAFDPAYAKALTECRTDMEASRKEMEDSFA